MSLQQSGWEDRERDKIWRLVKWRWVGVAGQELVWVTEHGRKLSEVSQLFLTYNWINPLNTKINLNYIYTTQSVPRSKHSISLL
jgi:hypothetical protein